MPFAVKVEHTPKTNVESDDKQEWLRSPLREIAGHLVLSDKKVYAWYRLSPTRWTLLTAKQQEGILSALRTAYTGLAGRDLKLRGTNRPYSAAKWAHAFSTRKWAHSSDDYKMARTVPDNPAAIDRYTQMIQAELRETRLTDPEWYIRVEVCPRTLLNRIASARAHGKPVRKAKGHMGRILSEIDTIMTQSHLRARRATQEELVWLQHKSRGLFLPEPVNLEQANVGGAITSFDVTTFEDRIHVDPRPFNDTLRITSRGGRCGPPRRRAVKDLRRGMRILLDVNGCTTPVRIEPIDTEPDEHGSVRIGWEADDGRIGISTFSHDGSVTIAPAERYVAMLRISRMEPQEVPGPHGPWLARAARMPSVVEINVDATVKAGEDARKKVISKLKLMADQDEQQRSLGLHGSYISDELEEATAAARRAAHVMRSGSARDSTEFQFTVTIAVAGGSHEEAMERAHALIALYKDPQIVIEWPEGKEALLSEFDIAAERRISAYMRYAFADLFVAGVPTATSRIGDREGIYLGETVGATRTAACWDPFREMFISEGSGLTPIIAGLGEGKSNLLGMLLFYTALSGVSVTALDWSGPLARLCYHPDIAPHATHLDLRKAPPGTLSPFGVVADPLRENCANDEEYALAVLDAQLTRKDLALDVMRMLLDKKTREDARTDRILESVMARMPLSKSDSLDGVVARLKSMRQDSGRKSDEWASVLAETLENRSQSRYASLFFKASQGTLTNARMLIITMAGINLPEKGQREEEWTREQRIAVPAVFLASFLTTKRLYSRKMGTPHMIGLDEQHWLQLWASGKSFQQRLARDSRKWRAVVLVGSQHPDDILGQGVSNFVGSAFIGRIEDEDAQSKACGLIRTEPTTQHKKIIGGLSPRDTNGKRQDNRQFVWRHAATGNVEVVAIRIVDPLLRSALNPQDSTFDVFLPSEGLDLAA